ncbi:MAG: hypothetical protein A2945_01180 [Candidatus Liptonbacteria bacterium RIFCSPLOWO2_01_FULL_52_25]|uniref:FAD/NAD(P)-binding domain-containing protein n=1 Tax=Candidatus Liptonbacteria bacterium RIFCSPLOWO2_01_FULL_52_25 TaxID=1798650 RepID=A0A1G2CDH2_9BACT|nr:MAG: hypothetical protein A2945_01180 [Candidatus Liptonbacteria bacterium RIFCSPLOWO2_01_FULL_52_25]
MKHIVILGAGFGGLRAAMDIAKKLRGLNLLDKYEVVLIDRSDCHLYTPLLYKVATSPSMHENVCTYDISPLIKELPIRFVQDEVTNIDLPNGDVHLKGGAPIKTDFLVVALGSETNYFGIPGLKENSLQLKTVESAMEVQNAIRAAFAQGSEVKIVAGGAGANGIELAAELRLWANRAERENKNLKVSVSIIEAMPTVLPGLDVRVVRTVATRLQRLGVAVMTGAKIVSVAPREISLDGNTKISFDVFIWTGGIKTPEMISVLPIKKEPRGKPITEAHMACLAATPDLKLHPMIYGLGDSVCFMNPITNRPIPAVAPAAIAQANVVAHNIIEEIKVLESRVKSQESRMYIPREYPYVIPAGGRYAIAKIGPLVISGFLGWLFEKLVALNYLLSIMPFFRAVGAWLK